MIPRRAAAVALILAIELALITSGHAAPPTISNLSLHGLQTGGVTTLVIDGAELLPEPRVVLSVPISKQTVHTGGDPRRVEIEIGLPADIPAGIYNLRLATPEGISNAVPIALDSLRQLAAAPQTVQLPAAISGNIAGGQVVQTSFTLKKGEAMVAEVEARRIGGGLDPVLHIYDSRRVPLVWAEGRAALDGDARLQFTAPADGTYTVELHDSVYQAAAPGQFRLKLGAFDFADLVYPPAVRRGSKTSLAFSGTSFPATDKVDFVAPPADGIVPAPWPSGGRPAGLRPRVLVSDVEEILKSPPADGTAQKVNAPAGVSGRLDKPQSEDRYRVTVSPGMRLRLEVLAARIGSPLDGVLTVRDEHGNQLAMNDDQPDTVDPGLDFTVPPGVPAIIVGLKDVAGRGGEGFVYHLAITKLDAPRFTLTVDDDRVQIPVGGAALVRVRANRTNYNGPIKLTFPGLPSSVHALGDEIPAGADQTFVELTSDDGSTAPGLFSIRGTGHDGDTLIERLAETAVNPVPRQPWLRSELAAAVVRSPAFGLAMTEASAETTLKPGAKLPLQLKATRGPGTAGAVRLSLITSQPMPKKKVRVNNQDQEQDDFDRALRLESAPVIAADKTDATVQLLVPADLPPAQYQLVVRGELLAADGARVLGTTYAPVIRANVSAPAEPPKQPNASPPLAIFEDEADFADKLNQGDGKISLVSDDHYSGKAALRVTPDQRFNPSLPGLNVKIRQIPAAGEYRYLMFAWKKKGGAQLCLQLSHDGLWGPTADSPGHKFRYHAGPGPECFGASLAIDPKLPEGWTLVTRDLYADFGEFTLTGLALSPIDGDYALFDHIYLGRHAADFSATAK